MNFDHCAFTMCTAACQHSRTLKHISACARCLYEEITVWPFLEVSTGGGSAAPPAGTGSTVTGVTSAAPAPSGGAPAQSDYQALMNGWCAGVPLLPCVELVAFGAGRRHGVLVDCLGLVNPIALLQFLDSTRMTVALFAQINLDAFSLTFMRKQALLRCCALSVSDGNTYVHQGTWRQRIYCFANHFVWVGKSKR
jgi:hypothetical protein